MNSMGAIVVDRVAVARTAVVASPEPERRTAIGRELRVLRWQVREVAGGAEAISALEEEPAELLVLDDWLPDLEVSEVAGLARTFFPEMDQLRMDTGFESVGAKSPRRSEVLLAVRSAQLTANLLCEPVAGENSCDEGSDSSDRKLIEMYASREGDEPRPDQVMRPSIGGPRIRGSAAALPDMVGDSAVMREMAWLVRLVAPRSTTVLIEGDTGTGKELVAKAIHRLSGRANKPFIVLNCAAIPEALLEAELFGHTRGAFTGAVQSRVGRVEAAHGGTLFLDEIGEMPLPLQAKMLRFLECGEIQRVGGNESVRVDARIIAATHQPLKQRSLENAFRLDLYHRLAVFPVRVPSLKERKEDLPALAKYLLDRLGEDAPIKRLTTSAEQLLIDYDWPGNVRELAHVLERATILSEDRPEINEYEIRF